MMYLKLTFAFSLGLVVGIWAMTLLEKRDQILQNTRSASLLRAPELITLQDGEEHGAKERVWDDYRASLVCGVDLFDIVDRGRIEGTVMLRLQDVDFAFQLEIVPLKDERGQPGFQLRLTSSSPDSSPVTTTTKLVGISCEGNDLTFHFPAPLVADSVREPANPVESAEYEKELGSFAVFMFKISRTEERGLSTIYAMRSLDPRDSPAAVGTLQFFQAP